MRAETGVGPSIASGNQVCKKICADFPMAPRSNKRLIKFNRSAFQPNILTSCPLKKGAKEKRTPNSMERHVQKRVMIPKVKATSLIRFTIKALMADLLA